MKEIGIMEIGGFKVGHAQNTEAATGCTALLFDAAVGIIRLVFIWPIKGE